MRRLTTFIIVLCLLLMSVNAFAFEELAAIEYPLDTDVVLKMWIPINSGATNRITSYDENDSFIYAQQATGVDIEFIHPSNSAITEEFNLMVTSDNLPDIIVNGRYQTGAADSTQCVNGVEDGIYIDLTDYMADYSPVYWNDLHTNEEFYQDATTADGRVYWYTNYKTATSYEEGSYDRIHVRADWLEELGMDTLRTIDDYETYFKYVLDNKEGVIPYSLVKTGIEKDLLCAFDTFEGWYQVDGQVKWGQVDDGFGEYLQLIRSWFTKGYISPDFTTYAGETDAFLAGMSGAVSNSAGTQFTKCAAVGIKTQNCPYMRKYEGQQIYGFYYLRPANGQYAVISSQCKHVDIAMKFMDYGYTDIGGAVYSYGIPGTAWEYNDAGQPIYTDYILDNQFGYSVSECSYILRLHEGFPHLRAADSISNLSNFTTEGALAYRLAWNDDELCDLTGHCLPSSLSLLTEDSLRRTEIMNEIETYRDEMVLKFITGIESLDRYPEYQQHIWDLGLQEAIDLTQKAYDTLLAKVIPE